MTDELYLRRKFTFRVGDRQIVLIKKRVESAEHVTMKVLLWALYSPHYPHLSIEVPVGDRYKPDVVQLDSFGNPQFWGEAGQVGSGKLQSLVRRFRHTHFAFAKWDTSLRPHGDLVGDALAGLRRSAPFDLINFPVDSVERFIDASGRVDVSFDDVEWMRFSPQLQ